MQHAKPKNPYSIFSEPSTKTFSSNPREKGGGYSSDGGILLTIKDLERSGKSECIGEVKAKIVLDSPSGSEQWDGDRAR